MPNEEIRATWSDNGTGWVENEAIFDATFTPITAAVLDAAPVSPGLRVLDVGCGSGTLLAAAVAAGAEAVGVDISPTMVAAARRRVPEAVVVEADAQVTDLLPVAPGRPFDRVVSRFGVMFFDDPVAAFSRVRSACASGAVLSFACWRAFSENASFSLGQDVLVARMGETPADPDPTAPGPTAFADPDRVRSVLTSAGWSEVSVDPLDATLDYAYDGTDGVDNRLATIFATTTGRRARARLQPSMTEADWASLVDDVRERLREELTDGRLLLPAACWLVTARA